MEVDGQNGKMIFIFILSAFGPVNRPPNWKCWESCGEELDYHLIIKLLRA
jgi:hypothetical protein